MPWCARCGVPIDEGPILCDQCVPRENLSQSARVEMTSAPRVVIDSEGNIIENIPGYGHTTMKAWDMSAGSKSRAPLRADHKVRWNRDRKQYELCVLLFDRREDLYCETWFDMATGEITCGPKQGPLSDQSIHGPRP